MKFDAPTENIEKKANSNFCGPITWVKLLQTCIAVNIDKNKDW